jgi:tRNA-splicing ligase RtcB
MYVVYDKDKQHVPIKIWRKDSSEVEEGCMEQIINASNLPFAFRHLALMADCHQGFGAPIGGVLASKGYICPFFVGVDIGCGMGYIQTNIPVKSFETATTKDGQNLIWAMLSTITRSIPVGFSHHKVPQEDWLSDPGSVLTIVGQEYESSLMQLGTLGGGNHFIDLQIDQYGYLAIMLHSGSRNLGKKVCDHYNKIAQDLNERYHSKIPSEWKLAYLPIDSDEGEDYRIEMNLCLQFAQVNRKLMMERAKNVVLNMLEKYAGIKGVEITQEINIHHNYAAMEHHFGENVLVHRKGATKAALGQLGIIPGSMGTESYIVRGLGNPESFESCSHGAGRAMGRKAATAKYTAQQVIEDMKKRNIYVLKANKEDIAEECPMAYKDINQVITQQSDLVEVVNILKPIGVIIA